jgi:hypothetical protein
MENGKPAVKIDVLRLGPGWAFVKAADEAPPPEELPRWLNQALTDWLGEHPDYRVRAALPVASQGNTFGIHIWFDRTG